MFLEHLNGKRLTVWKSSKEKNTNKNNVVTNMAKSYGNDENDEDNIGYEKIT